MKIAVTYYSRTGNTKKVAEAAAKAAGCSAVPIAEFKPEAVDLLFIGGSIYGGALDPSLVSFISGLESKDIKSAALFSTCITHSNAIDSMKDLLGKKGIPVADTFTCKGKFLLFNIGRPKAADLEDAAKFAASVISK